MNENDIYIGCYGILLKDKSILVIKKAKGPYIGQFDLPGGGIKFGETMQECLAREIFEETGCKILKTKIFDISEYQCQYNKNGTPINFHHIAIYYLVNCKINKIKTLPDGKDSLGAKFMKLTDLTSKNTSPVAYQAVKKIKKHDC